MKRILTLLSGVVLACSVMALPVSAKSGNDHHSSYVSVHKNKHANYKTIVKKTKKPQVVYVKKHKRSPTIVKVVKKPSPTVSLILTNNVHYVHTF